MTGEDLHWEKVTDPQAVDFLSGPSARYFTPFLARENTVAEVARELKVAPNKLLYHVQKAVSLGLLKVVRVQRRAGKPVKTYCSSAESYFIPFEHLPTETLESWLLPLEHDWHARWVNNAAQVMRQSEVPFGLRLWRDAQQPDIVIVKPTPAPPVALDDTLLSRVPVLALWSELRLSAVQAQALNSELLDVYERYARMSALASGGTSHLLHLAVTPVHHR